MKKITLLSIMTFVALIFNISQLTVSAETTTLTITSNNNVVVAPNASFSIDVSVQGATDLVGFQTKLLYDETQFTFDTITPGDILGKSLTQNTNSPGELLINYVDVVTRINGDATLFTLHFTASTSLSVGEHSVLIEDTTYNHEFIALDSENNLTTFDEVLFDFNNVQVGLFGDIDHNDLITISDVALIQLFIEGLITLSETEQSLADVNGDLDVTLTDAAQIQLYIADLITTLKPE